MQCRRKEFRFKFRQYFFIVCVSMISPRHVWFQTSRQGTRSPTTQLLRCFSLVLLFMLLRGHLHFVCDLRLPPICVSCAHLEVRHVEVTNPEAWHEVHNTNLQQMTGWIPRFLANRTGPRPQAAAGSTRSDGLGSRDALLWTIFCRHVSDLNKESGRSL